MCRSIHDLRRTEPQSTVGDAEEAARQYVRKVSGYQKPSQVNTEAFEAAVQEVAEATERLLAAVGAPLPAGESTWEERRAILRATRAAADGVD